MTHSHYYKTSITSQAILMFILIVYGNTSAFAEAGGMMGGGGMIFMAVGMIAVLGVLFLIIVALVKYLRKK